MVSWMTLPLWLVNHSLLMRNSVKREDLVGQEIAFRNRTPKVFVFDLGEYFKK